MMIVVLLDLLPRKSSVDSSIPTAMQRRRAGPWFDHPPTALFYSRSGQQTLAWKATTVKALWNLVEWQRTMLLENQTNYFGGSF